MPLLTFRVPVPLMAWLTATWSVRLKAKVALLTMGPVPSQPLALLLPTCSVPALMVVPPV